MAILVLPIVSLLVLAGVVTVDGAVDARAAGELVDLASVSAASGGVASRLSDERSAAALCLLDACGRDADLFDDAVAEADAALGHWAAAREAVRGREGDLAPTIRRVDGLVDGLGRLRQQVRTGEDAAVSVVVLRYRLVIAALLQVRQGLIVAGAPIVIADRIRAVAGLSQASESAGLLQVAVLRAIAAGSLTPAAAAQVAAARAGWTDALDVWGASADPMWRGWLDQAMSGERLLAAQRLDGLVSRTVVGQRLTVSSGEWAAVQQARQERLREVSARVDAEIIASLDGWGRERTVTAVLTGGSTTMVLAVGLLLAWYVARRLVRSLVWLQHSVMGMAEVGLPQAVAAMADRQDLDGLTRELAAERAGVLLPVAGSDEVADVTRAFNVVQGTALGLALEQVQARRRVSGMFVDLGRRQQLLVDRLIAALDTAERDEQDPDRLAALFGLDHLATRMRRSNANLLLLGGVPTSVATDRPVGLADVLLAAVSQVEGYRRVEIVHADDEVLVRAAAVTTVVQALAELIDNACNYSPAAEPVRVSGRRLGDRAVVEVVDAGIGMTDAALEQANSLLSHGRADVPALRAMGLQVVARVAALQRLSVRLLRNDRQGLSAEMVLPADLLELAFLRRPPGTQVPPPRLMDRRTSAQAPPWPPIAAAEANGTVTPVGLPVRSRNSAYVQPPGSVVASSRRSAHARSRALSSMQQGIQAARAARRTNTNPWGERS